MKDIETLTTNFDSYRQRLEIAAGTPAWSSLSIQVATPANPDSAHPDIFLSFVWCNLLDEGTKRIERQLSILELSLSDNYLEYVIESMADDIRSQGL